MTLVIQYWISFNADLKSQKSAISENLAHHMKNISYGGYTDKLFS